MREELLRKYTSYLSLLKKLSNLQKDLEESEAEYQEELENEKRLMDDTYVNANLNITFISLAAAVFLIAVVVFHGGEDKLIIGCVISMEMMLFFFWAFISMVLKGKHRTERFNELDACRERLVELENEDIKLKNRYKIERESQELIEFEQDVPLEYRSIRTLEFFVKALRNRRADTDKELFNLYENEKYQMETQKKIEAVREIQEIQRQNAEEMSRKNETYGRKCPKCGSTLISPVTETRSKSKGGSMSDACCGYICFGPLGILCGFLGDKGSNTTNTTYWICGNCGAKFR